MDSKLKFSRLWRWVQTRPDANVPDAADVGTAFGMELSIEAEQREANQAAAAKPLETTRAPTRPRR
jgi:hypothetical protein